MADTSSMRVYAPDRYLPIAPGATTTLVDDEPLAAGLSRLTQRQFAAAIDQLAAWASAVRPDAGSTIEQVAADVERLQAVLRLVRSEIGDAAYDAESRVLERAGGLLEPGRRSVAMSAILATIRARHAAQLRPTVFVELQTELDARRDRELAATRADRDRLDAAVHLLRRAQARYAAWPTGDDDPGDRSPIRHAFDSVGPGIERSYAQARKRLRAANQSRAADDFARLIRPITHLRHQLDILQPLWPDLIEGTVRSLARLEAMVREETDLADLLRLLAAEPALLGDAAERSLLTAVTQQRRAELHETIVRTGARVFAEPTERFVERFAWYWDAWNLPPSTGLALPR